MKSYLVFAGARYRLAVYLLMPAVLLGIGLWVEGKLGSGNGGVGAIVVTVLLPMAEISSDNWLFGGIQAKDSMGLEYLKASGRGMGIVKKALWMDLARKFLSALGIIALHRLAAALVWGWAAGGAPGSRPGIAHSWLGNAGSAVGVLLYFVLVAYIVSALGTFLSRFGGMFWMNQLRGRVPGGICPDAAESGRTYIYYRYHVHGAWSRGERSDRAGRHEEGGKELL